MCMIINISRAQRILLTHEGYVSDIYLIGTLILTESDILFFLQDSDVISGIKSRLLDLQAEVDKLNQTCIHMVEEHNAKQKHIDVSS